MSLDELHRRMGRNLSFYQSIESTLKILLPYISSVEMVPTGVLDLNGKLPTLGVLANEYFNRIDAKWEGGVEGPGDALALFKAPLLKVTTSRNRLVHAFFHAPNVDTFTRAGLEEGLRLLDRDHQEAQDAYDDFVPMLLAFIHEMSSRSPGKADLALLLAVLSEYAERRKLVVFVHKADYRRVIELLKEAEVKSPKVEGLTHLSWAGSYIRKSEPGFKPEQVGEKNLAGVLQATGLFEVFKRQYEGSSAFQLLYRSIPLAAQTEHHFFPR